VPRVVEGARPNAELPQHGEPLALEEVPDVERIALLGVNTKSSSATCSGIAFPSASATMEWSHTSRRDFLVFV
jgi:hypothetical protein